MDRRTIGMVSLFVSLFCHATEGDYPVSKIPANLLVNANAVVRADEMRFEILGLRETVLKEHLVVTILNENGDRWSDFEEYYDQLRQVSYVEGFLYDAAGKQLKKMKYKDLQDLSAYDGFSLAGDDRLKKHNFYYRNYPYTVEYESEIHYNHTFFFPSWSAQGGEKLSVEKSQVSIVCAPDYKFRYEAFKYPGPPLITEEKGKKVSTWSAANLAAIKREDFGPAWHEISPYVIFGPSDFQLGDYKGNMNDWAGLSKFQYQLNQGRDVLPEAVKQRVHELIKGTSDVKTQISILYEYMQKNTRYISVQLGIGGWQPFDANYVATKGYGDCKALSNYMFSLLKEAGIKSYYTVIRAGEGAKYMTSDFPSNQFNHIIVFAPVNKDTVWLECTSQTLPAGYLSDFTADRYGLMVAEEGGKLVHTPKYSSKENVQFRKIRAKLVDADLQLEETGRYTGEAQDDLHGVINHLSKDKVKEYLHDRFDFGTYEVSSFDFKENRTRIPSVDETLSIIASNYATTTGRRIFIAPNPMTRSVGRLKEDEDRKYDIVLSEESTKIDSVEIEMPNGYEPEAMPQDVTLSSDFGQYESTTRLNGNKLLHYRRMLQYSGRFPPGRYGDLAKFYAAIYKADHSKMVLVKKE